MDPLEFCAKARELREKARTIHDQKVRGHMLAIAEQYDWLAARAENQERESEKP